MIYFSKSTLGFYDTQLHGGAIPVDAVEITPEQHKILLDGQSTGKVIAANADGYPVLVDPPPPSPEQIIKNYTGAVQRRLDNFFRSRGYDGILSAATYATSTIEKFSIEGQYAVDARDNTWHTCYQILAEVESGQRELPTIEQLLDELPVLAWPN